VRDLIEPEIRWIGSCTGWTRSEIINQPKSKFLEDVVFFRPKGKQ